ncbi:hypothetical protein ACFX4N_23560 [Priestia sp. YIM B13551]|uniref:DUF4376 domain-containing protein n=1 Tax=Priestia sp. YIM B13551 TaxID=3366306 RepID=UPI0036722B48
MIQIQPNNKVITDKRKAELRGELTAEFVNMVVINQGYPALASYQVDLIKQLTADSKDEELSELSDEDILEYCKILKNDFFKTTCEEKILEGFTASNGHFYRTNRDDQINFIGQKDLLVANESLTTVPWKTEDVGYIVHTRDEWLQIYNEAFSHKQAQLFKYDNLKKQVMAATDHVALSTIKWT